MKTNVALIFFLKKPKNYVSGPVPIYLRITVNGRRAEFSCGRTCDVKRWNSGTGRAIGTKEDVRSLNGYLDSLQRKMYYAQSNLVDEQSEITIESLKERFSGREKQSYLLLDLFSDHNSRAFAPMIRGLSEALSLGK